MTTAAFANSCSIVLIKDGRLDMLDVGGAITLAEQCHAAGEPVPNDPCDVRLFYRPGGLIQNLPAGHADFAKERDMMRACVQNRMAVMEAMAQIQRDLITPLHDAITSGQGPQAVAQILDETGAQYVNVADTEGVTPLHAVMKHGANPEIVRLLLDAGANPNAASDDLWPVLHSAISNNAPRAVLSSLIEAGADPSEVLINENAIGSLYREANAVSIALRSGYDIADLKWIYAQTGFDIMPYRRSFYLYAANHPDPEALTFLSEISAPPRDSHEATEVLFDAAYNDAHPQVIAKLFALGADGVTNNLHHSNGRSVLHYMIHHPHDLKTIQALIENGATMGPGRTLDYTLLVAASRHPDPEVLRYLGSLNIDRGIQQNFNTAIDLARRSRENAAEKVAVLEELGFVSEFTCSSSCPTVIDAVTADRSIDDMRKIIDAGGDIYVTNRAGNGVLHFAVQNKNVSEELIRFLIEVGADPNLRNDDGETPLHRAIDQGADGFAAAMMLLRNGADPNLLGEDNMPLVFKVIAQDSALPLLRGLAAADAELSGTGHTGQTPIFTLLSEPLNVSTQAYLKLLLSSPHDISIRAADGDTALYQALKIVSRPASFSSIVEAFLAAGYDPNLLDESGASALHLAITNKHHPDTVRALLDAGADTLQVNGEGLNPLELALLHGAPDPIPAALLMHGSNANAVDENGLRPLHSAATHGAESGTFVALLEHGADPQLRTPAGELPIQLVKANRQMWSDDQQSHAAVRQILRDYGGGTNFLRELHLAGWTPWIAGGFAVLLMLAFALWRMTRPVRIV